MEIIKTSKTGSGIRIKQLGPIDKRKRKIKIRIIKKRKVKINIKRV